MAEELLPTGALHPSAVLAAVRREPLLALLVAIVATIPLEFTRPWFPTGSLDAARIGMIVGIAYVVVRVVRGRGVVLPPRPVLLAVAAVVAVDLVSLAVFRWSGAPKAVIALLGYVGFALFATQAITDRRALRIVLIALFVTGVLEALLLLAQQMGDFYLWYRENLVYLGRRNGTFVDPNLTARMLVIALLAGLGLQATDITAGRHRWFIAAGLAAIGLGAVVTFSRTGWFLLGLTCVAWLLLTRRRELIALGPLVVVVAFSIGFLAVPRAMERASDVPAAEDSGPAEVSKEAPAIRTTTDLDGLIAAAHLGAARTYLARSGVAMFEDHPLFGVGLGGFQPQLLGPYRAFIPRRIVTANPISLQHMDVLRIAAEEGIIGLAAFVAFLAAIAWLGIRSAIAATRDRPIVWASVGSVAVILIASQTEGRFYTDSYLWLLVAVVVSCWRLSVEPAASLDVTPRETVEAPRREAPAADGRAA